MMRRLILFALALCGWLLACRVHAGVAEELDDAEHLALWGYSTLAWERLGKYLPPAVLSTGAGLAPRQRAQLAFVRAHADIDGVGQAAEYVDLEAWIDAESAKLTESGTPPPRREGLSKLNAAVAAALSSCGQLHRHASDVATPDRPLWTLRAHACDTGLALIRRDYAAAQTLGRQALALPGTERLAERVTIHLALASAAAAGDQSAQVEEHMHAGMQLVASPAAAPQAYALWHAIADYRIEAGQTDAARSAINRFIVAHEAGPPGALHAWREREVADLLYRVDTVGEAESHWKAALQGQLDAPGETPVERLNGVASMLAYGGPDAYRPSKVRIAFFLLEHPIQERYARLPAYRALVDLYARDAFQTRDAVIMQAVEKLRGPGGELDAAMDEQVRATLNEVGKRAAGALRPLIASELRLPDPTGRDYFGHVRILTATLGRLQSAYGAAADPVRDTVMDLALVHQSASRPDLARGELFSYQADVLADTLSSPDQIALTLRRIAHQLRAMDDPRSADDTAALGEREARRAQREACQRQADRVRRMLACLRHADVLTQAGRTAEAIDVLLREHDQLKPAPENGLDVVHAGQLANALEGILQRTELAAGRERFFRADGQWRQVRVSQVCRAMLDSSTLAQLDGYCALRQTRAGHVVARSGDLDEERKRLFRWALQAGQADIARVSAGISAKTVDVLRALGRNTVHPRDLRRLALLLAWETRAGLQPNNPYTEADILLDLSDLYVEEENVPLMLAWVERALALHLQAGNAKPAFLRRVLEQVARTDATVPAAARVLQRLAAVLAGMRAPTGSAELAVIIDIALVLASNAPPPLAMDSLERLAQHMAGDAAQLSGKDGATTLDTVCDLAARTGKTPALAPRAYRLVRVLLAQQDRLHIAQAPARIAVLEAAIGLAPAAGAGADVALLVDRLAQIHPEGEADGITRDRIVVPWHAARRAAQRLSVALQALSKAGERTDTAETAGLYADAVTTAVDARDFVQAAALLDRLLEHAVRSMLRSRSGLHDVNPLRELLLRMNPPCSANGGRLVPSPSLFPGTSDGCGKLMATWLRDVVLYDAFVGALADADGRTPGAADDLDAYLGWEAALADAGVADAAGRATMVAATLDVARAPHAVLGRDRAGGDAALMNRLRAFIDGTDRAWRDTARTFRVDEAGLILHLTGSRMLAWIVRGDGRVAFRQWEASRGEIRAVTRAVRQQFYISAGAIELPTLELGPLATLYRLVMQPLEPALQGIRQLYVMPNGALALVPYAVLLTAAPERDTWRPGDSWRPPWLLDRMGVRVLRALGEPRHVARGVDLGDGAALFLGVGDPVPATLAEGLRAGAPCVGALDALEGAADELRASAALFGARAKLLSGPEFTLDAVRGTDLARYRYLLFASHAVQPDGGGCTDESAVVTSIGKRAEPPLLKASAVATISLSAQLVLLSACESGVDDLEKEAQPIGTLAGAFLDAGADAVVVSGWPVVSAHAGQLTVGLLRALRDGGDQDAARALRQTMLSLSRSSDPALSHPLVWGAPFIVGAP